MRIKLNKSYKDTPEHSVVECDEVTGKALIADGTAVEYTDTLSELEHKNAVKALAKAETKTINVNVKGKAMDKNIIGKALRAIREGKAVTGMSEGTANDGGALVGTFVSEIMGVAMDGSKVYSKCRKIVLPARMNAAKIPVDNSDPWIKATAPVPTNPAEGGDKTATKLAFLPRTLTLAKTVLYVPVTDELLEDDATLDGFVRGYLRSKLAGTLDGEILTGNAGGYAKISGDTGYCGTASITEATPTAAELYAMVAQIDPRLIGGAEWFIAPAQWAYIVGALATSANIQNQLIDVSGMKLFGKAVTVMPQLTGKAILVNLSAYTVVEPSVTDVIEFSRDVRFYNDESVFRLVHRGAGALTWASRTAADATTLSAAVEST